MASDVARQAIDRRKEQFLRAFRFGVALYHSGGLDEWARKATLAETLGYHALSQPHLPGLQAPLSAFAAAAALTERIRLCPIVLNPTAWRPDTLAHELATLDRLSGGRLEIGLGLGAWRPADFDASAFGTRIGLLKQTIEAIDNAATSNDAGHRFAQEPRPPLHIAGAGERVVELAANTADIFNLYTVDRPLPGATGIALIDANTAHDGLARFVRLAGERAEQVELCTGLHVVITDDARRAAEQLQPLQAPHLTVEQILESPKTAFGAVNEIAAQLRHCREQFGYSYFVVGESMMLDFAPVIELLANTP